MRIVAGRHRGRPLGAPPGWSVRPTADRVRESVFNILAHGAFAVDLEGVTVLDAFAGTGALGLEAISRGAARAIFLDADTAALAVIRRNAARLGEAHNVCLLRLDAAEPPPPPRIANAPASVAFIDAPYGSGLATPALAGLARRGWLAPDAICVVETGAKEAFAPPPGFALLDERRYGPTRVLFLRRKGDEKNPTTRRPA